MSNPPHQYGGHGSTRFESMSDSANPAMAMAPKGTLTLRHMTSRAGNYEPERVQVPGYGYQPHGPDMLHDEKPSVVLQFLEPANRRKIIDAVLASLPGDKLAAENIPTTLVTRAMTDTLEVYGESAANAPHALVGPSESMSWLAPAHKYGDGVEFDLHAAGSETLAQLNLAAARDLRDLLVSETALLSRYHGDLAGAIHVLEYPTRPGPELRRGHQLNYRYYDNISSAANSGISGNRLLPNRVIDSAKVGEPNVQQWPNTQFQFQRRL